MLNKIIQADRENRILNEHHKIAFDIILKIRKRIEKDNYITAEILQNACHKSSFIYLINRSVFDSLS